MLPAVAASASMSSLHMLAYPTVAASSKAVGRCVVGQHSTRRAEPLASDLVVLLNINECVCVRVCVVCVGGRR